jgi:hypothetical protein
MDNLTNWKNLSFSSLNEIIKDIVQALPSIFAAILIIFFGWLITKGILYLLKKVLKVVKIDDLSGLINNKNLLGRTKIKIDLVKLITGFVKWFIYLVLLIVVSDILDWKIISTEIGNLLRYLPKLFGAVILFMIGLYIANFLRNTIKGLFESLDLIGSKIISSMVFYLIAILVTITALNQAGIDTKIITNNITLIIGAFFAAVALAFGLGSKDVVGDLLRSYYVKKNYEIGQQITIEDISGTIESIDNISVTIKTTKGKTILPIKDVSLKRVDIINKN